MLKLKLQYFGYLMGRTDSLGKTLMLGNIEGERRRGQQRMRWLDSTTDSMDMSLSKLGELVMDRKPGVLLSMGSQRVRHDCLRPLEIKPSSIAPHPVESREAPTNSTVSLSSQRHNEKLPEGHRHKSREPWVFCHDSRKTSRVLQNVLSRDSPTMTREP